MLAQTLVYQPNLLFYLGMWKKKAGGVSQALNDQLKEFDTETIEVSIEQIEDTIRTYLLNSGFNSDETELTLRNLMEAEYAGKASHGIIRLPDLRLLQKSGDIKTGTTELRLVSSSDSSLYFDAEYMSGSVAVYRSLDYAFDHLGADSGRQMVMVGIKNMSYASGYIGDFARMAASMDLIFLSFFNSPPILIPHGSADPQWGTNPLTFAFPSDSHKAPAVFDAASSVITWGEMMNRKREGRELPHGVALDESGQPTLLPREGMKGGLLTSGGHKGSGLAMMVEMMAGALTGSRVGTAVDGGWGGSYLLIRPGIFRGDGAQVMSEARQMLDALEQSTPRNKQSPAVYPGESSSRLKSRAVSRKSLELPRLLWEKIFTDA